MLNALLRVRVARVARVAPQLESAGTRCIASATGVRVAACDQSRAFTTAKRDEGRKGNRANVKRGGSSKQAVPGKFSTSRQAGGWARPRAAQRRGAGKSKRSDAVNEERPAESKRKKKKAQSSAKDELDGRVVRAPESDWDIEDMVTPRNRTRSRPRSKKRLPQEKDRSYEHMISHTDAMELLANEDQRRNSVFKRAERLMILIEEEKGENTIMMDVYEKCDWTDIFIITTGKSQRHLRAICEQVMVEMNQSLNAELAPINIEGLNADDWMVVDGGDIVVHAMTEEGRKRYDLEGLWQKRLGGDKEHAVNVEEAKRLGVELEDVMELPDMRPTASRSERKKRKVQEVHDVDEYDESVFLDPDDDDTQFTGSTWDEVFGSFKERESLVRGARAQSGEGSSMAPVISSGSFEEDWGDDSWDTDEEEMYSEDEFMSDEEGEDSEDSRRMEQIANMRLSDDVGEFLMKGMERPRQEVARHSSDTNARVDRYVVSEDDVRGPDSDFTASEDEWEEPSDTEWSEEEDWHPETSDSDPESDTDFDWEVDSDIDTDDPDNVEWVYEPGKGFRGPQ